MQEAAEHSRQGAGSSAFRQKGATAILTELIDILALFHGLLLASNDCDLLHEGEHREAASTHQITHGITNMAVSAPPGGHTHIPSPLFFP